MRAQLNNGQYFYGWVDEKKNYYSLVYSISTDNQIVL